ncbi:hypothetical protein [Streptomyces sp. BE133]|uniref:hypothetical protein n=1 Tax=Streptomyces sp. BE133 TaxID=3002523 RepID=UPI002E77C8A0|nr:hypothetical protein [Streptomyces sp. BE133]MEE1812650.1 hypothetical protein [Streptomyces sp. BE133]
MSPLERLINESIPDGTYGDIDRRPWTPAEQLAHRLVLEEAIDGWHWTGDPRSHCGRAAA